MKYFPVDVFGIKKIGIEKWQDEFFWPVKDDEFFFLIDQVCHEFQQEIESQSQTLQDIMVSASGLTHQYALFLHSLLVIKRLQDHGYQILCDDRSEYYWELLNKKFKTNFNQTHKKSEIIKDSVKQVIKFFIFNRFSPENIISTFETRKTVLSLGSFTQLKRDFFKNHKGLILHGSNLRYFRSNHRRAGRKGSPPEVRSTVESLGKRLLRIAFRSDIPLDDFSQKYLELMTEQSFKTLHEIYDRILRNSRKRIDVLLLSEVAKPVNKAICFALKRKFGTKVIGFEHGNTFGNTLSKGLASTEMAHCDEFIVSTSNSIANFREIQKISRFPYGKSTKILSVDTSYYKRLWQINRSSSLPVKIRTVMLIGFPMNQYRYDEVPGHFSLFHLDLELRLLRFFRKNGLRVIYKVHPNRLKEAKGIFEGLAHEIKSEPFEEVYQECDAYVFGHTDTSTFGIALCTNKPIISIEIQGKRWNPGPYELIARRCKLVPAWIDSRSRVIYDESKLMEYIKEKVELANSEVVEQYMFPG